MKYILKYILPAILLGLIFQMSIFINRPNAQTTSPKAEGQQVEDLKDRLATKVAELAVSEPRAFNGIIKSTSLTSLVIETTNKTLKIELTDDITAYKLTGTKKQTIKTDDLKAQMNVTVIGQYDTTLELLKAKVIYVEPEIPMSVAGRIKDINQKGFSLKITTASGTDFTVDYEKLTKATINNLTGESVKVGFSKIPSDKLAIITGTRNEDDDQRISADRIFILDPNGISVSPIQNASPSSKIKN